jgi:serine protease inhibitor
MRAKYLFAAAIALFAITSISCSSKEPFTLPTIPPPNVTPTIAPENFTVAFSTSNRIQAPNITTDTLDLQVQGNNEFAFDLYHRLASDNTGNLFMSPYSVSAALAVTYAGARGNTATEMANTLHFNLQDKQPHAAFNELDLLLAARGSEIPLEEKFTLKDGTVKADMMHQTDMFKFVDADSYTAMEIPHVGNETSMIVLVPDDGEFTSFESSLDAAKLAQVIDGMRSTSVDLEFPKFSYESKFMLPQVLKQLGMLDAFNPFEADFMGMQTPPPSLLITDVIHQPFVAVDEQGTEAAAATAVIIGTTPIAPDPVQLTVDRPFMYLIRDIPTNTILFTGRVLNPED